jgi:hypothetical protein
MNRINGALSGAGNYFQNKVSSALGNETGSNIKDSFKSMGSEAKSNLDALKEFAGSKANQAVETGEELLDKASVSGSGKYAAAALPLAAVATAAGPTIPPVVVGVAGLLGLLGVTWCLTKIGEGRQNDG